MIVRTTLLPLTLSRLPSQLSKHSFVYVLPVENFRKSRAFSIGSFRMATFDRLIRFEAENGKTYLGDLGKEEVPTREIEGRTVQVLEGNVEGGFKRTGGEASVSKVR
jgi:hypothetical protein